MSFLAGILEGALVSLISRSTTGSLGDSSG